jgi:SAM-dependent methyltransferase
MMLNTWILTFNRPQALNRQIDTFSFWTKVNIFTNHPSIELSQKNMDFLNTGKIKLLNNTLSDEESTSYCARSWNNIFLKAFKDTDELICVQDDTFISDPLQLRTLIVQNRDKYDLMWAPAGDQFFYLKKKVLQTVGWFDERYLGCYCGDADWLKRVWQQYDRSRLSISESHDWGFRHNSIGLEDIIPTHIGAKSIDPTYINQHEEIQRAVGEKTNRILEHSQAFYEAKWGHKLNGTGPISQDADTDPGSIITEIDWYPWFTQKYLNGGTMGVNDIGEGSFLKRQQQFWGDIAKGWSLQNKNPVVGWYDEHENFPEYDTVLFRDIPVTGTEIVLEYGCGPGRNLIRWNKRFGRIDGVDISPVCIEKAKINLGSAGLAIPNLWSNDGRSLDMIVSASNSTPPLDGEWPGYDIVFMVISHQHITNRAVRLHLYKEFLRVLKPGGYLCFQTGFGPGHPRSVDYFTEAYASEVEFLDKDVRIENIEHIKTDLQSCGFTWLDHQFTRHCKDEHEKWVWIRCQKPNV